MRILKIIKGTASDGPGIRNSIYVAGCAHRCKGCHNPESWDFFGGQQMSVGEVLAEVLDQYADITISGGDPVYQHEDVTKLCKYLKAAGKNIWLFTGFLYKDLQMRCPELLKNIDVLVDGPYLAHKRDLTRFCGSSNQRILYLKNGEIYKEK